MSDVTKASILKTIARWENYRGGRPHLIVMHHATWLRLKHEEEQEPEKLRIMGSSKIHFAGIRVIRSLDVQEDEVLFFLS